MRGVALVTGAASGLGLALANELESTGWQVVRSDISPGGVVLDVTDPNAFQRVADEVGPIDLLVNNAGVACMAQSHHLLHEDWTRVLDINLRGVINGIQAVYPSMVRRKRGAILNTASLAGLLGFPGALPYAATKFAVVGTSLSLRAEARRHGIKVCVFCPGFLQTAIFDNCTYRGFDRDRVKARLNFPILPVEGGARAAVRGLERNRAIITYPFYASVVTLPLRLNHLFTELIFSRAMPRLLAGSTPEKP